MKLIDLIPRITQKKTREQLTQEYLKSLNEIGIALSAERDLNKLLSKILESARTILTADAGSIFLAEGNEDTPTHLRFKLAQNDSIPLSLQEFVIPVNSKSLVGHVATTRQALWISDVYRLPSSYEFSFNQEIDRKTGYRSMSLLSVPMLDHHDQLIGVVQVWNKKQTADSKITSENAEKEVIPFTEQDLNILASLTAQAAVAIENAQLYSNIQQLFEGFIRASVSAIEARDPTTAGHSERVATLTVALAKETHDFNEEELKEIQYASLLHDFGKIGVREAVLIKAKKLYPEEMHRVLDRMQLLHRTIELEIERKKLNHLLMGGKKGDAVWNEYEQDLLRRLAELKRAEEVIQSSNEPNILPREISEELSKLMNVVITLPDESVSSIITPEQMIRLSIPKGSLSAEERHEIESHVTHTYRFLQKIPWTRELRRVPDIAHSHHEKLDGTGYPRRILATDIPYPSKIMAVTDIFDALVARDRPYKQAVPLSKALDILVNESAQGKLDVALVRLFIDKRIYDLTTSPA